MGPDCLYPLLNRPYQDDIQVFLMLGEVYNFGQNPLSLTHVLLDWAGFNTVRNLLFLKKVSHTYMLANWFWCPRFVCICQTNYSLNFQCYHLSDMISC